MSARSPSAMRASTSPVEGSYVGKVFPDADSTHLPLISILRGLDRNSETLPCSCTFGNAVTMTFLLWVGRQCGARCSLEETRSWDRATTVRAVLRSKPDR